MRTALNLARKGRLEGASTVGNLGKKALKRGREEKAGLRNNPSSGQS